MINVLENTLNLLFKNKYLSVIVIMFLVFYGSKSAPKLLEIADFFDNYYFRIFILSMIVYKSKTLEKTKLPVIYSILVSVVFVLIFEKYDSIVKEKFSEYPACENKPDPGRHVQQVRFVSPESKKCEYTYSPVKYSEDVCKGTFDGVKFCVNSPNEDREIDGCYKFDPNLNICTYSYK